MMEQLSLFDDRAAVGPLASRLRPSGLEEFVGQKHLLGEGKVLRRIIDQDMVCSMIFWGPPGVGKTTLARIIANRTRASFVDFSAVTSGIKEIKEVMAQAERDRHIGLRTLVFVDEIHRFNKAQQDAFLPYVEKGSIILIGATTENPSFEINAALLSRCKVFVLQALQTDDLVMLLHHALTSPLGLGDQRIGITEDMLRMIAQFANGDARTALNTLEMAVLNGEISAEETTVTAEVLEQCISRKSLLYDKNGEEHYNLISALHKSMRNSDPDAALYWLARMLEAGEDPLYVKSNSAYAGYEHCKEDALHTLAEPVPLVIRNAPTGLMKELHYGEGYQYAHQTEDKIAAMQCMPDSLKDRRYYVPTEEGNEKAAKKRLEEVKAWREAHGM